MKSINKRSNLSNDTHLKDVERNNERVNRRFKVAKGGERRGTRKAEEENQWKKAKGREMRHFVRAAGLS